MTEVVVTYSSDACQMDASTRCLLEVFGPFATHDEAVAYAERLPVGFIPHTMILSEPPVTFGGPDMPNEDELEDALLQDAREGMCDCGQPLHYASQASELAVQRLMDELGPTLKVETPEGTWAVPRHYIALHGITAWEVSELAARYGWEKVK